MALLVEINDKNVLTAAQNRVLQALCHGKMRKEIARDTHKSVSAVSRHLEAIALKLEAHSAAEIVAKAVAHGLVRITLNMLLLLTMLNSIDPTNDLDKMRPPPVRLRVAATKLMRRNDDVC